MVVARGMTSRSVNNENTNEHHLDIRGRYLVGRKSCPEVKRLAGWLHWGGQGIKYPRAQAKAVYEKTYSIDMDDIVGLSADLPEKTAKSPRQKTKEIKIKYRKEDVYFVSSLSSSRYCRPALGPVALPIAHCTASHKPTNASGYLIPQCTLYTKILPSPLQLGLKVSHPFISVASSSPSRSTAEFFTGLDACGDPC